MNSSAAWVAVAVAVLGFLLAFIFLFPFGQHRIDLYVTDHCLPFSMKTDEVVETLVIKKDYLVTFLNRSDQPVEISLPPGWFNLDRATIPPARFVILEVLRQRADEQEYSIGTPCRSGAPRLKLVEST